MIVWEPEDDPPEPTREAPAGDASLVVKVLVWACIATALVFGLLSLLLGTRANAGQRPSLYPYDTIGYHAEAYGLSRAPEGVPLRRWHSFLAAVRELQEMNAAVAEEFLRLPILRAASALDPLWDRVAVERRLEDAQQRQETQIQAIQQDIRTLNAPLWGGPNGPPPGR